MTAESSPGISVIIYCYNHEKYLEECIDSILAQTLQPLEIIICDDHSTDSSFQIIEAYGRKHPGLIRPHRHDQNMGMHFNANYGLRQASGNLISSLGGDDRWLPGKLEAEFKVLRDSTGATIAYSNVYTIDAEGKRTGIWYDGKGPIPPSGDVFTEVFSRRFFTVPDNVFRNQLMYRSLLEETGYYDESIPIHLDWDFKIRLAARHKVVYSGEAMVEYRIHDEGVHGSPPAVHLESMSAVYEKNLPLLEERSIEESIRIRCNMESRLALVASLVKDGKKTTRYTADAVYMSNRSLLEQLSDDDREDLERELASELVSLALLSAGKMLFRGKIRTAFTYLPELLRHAPRHLNPGFIVSIVLPRWISAPAKTVFRPLRRALWKPGGM